MMTDLADDRVKELGIHLTLANLGEVKDESLSECITVLHNVMQNLNPINLEFSGEGFLRLPNAKFACVALVSGRGLEKWKHIISCALNDASLLDQEIDAFLPHITLAYQETPEILLSPSFGFKAFSVNTIYLTRGNNMKIPILAGGKKNVEQ
jgi:2'-5' RNA ligase